MQTLPARYGNVFPNIKISYEDQLTFATHIREGFESGRMWPLPFGGWNKGMFDAYPDFWFMSHFRYPTLDGVRVDTTKQRTFPIRFDDQYEWHWDEKHPLIDVVHRVMEPVLPFYKKLTRCQLLFANKGLNLPLHVDATGEAYIEKHRNNRFFGLKYPITEIEGNNGNPICSIDDVVFRYNVGNHLFAVNEAEMKHGALACDHWRGVMFIDGVIDMDYFDAQEKAGIEIVPV